MDKGLCFGILLIVFVFYAFSATGRKQQQSHRRYKRRTKTIYIYALKDGWRKFYVGQTVSPHLRLSQHINDAKMFGTPKERKIYWMLKTGRNPKMEIITKTQSPTKANELEKKYIKRWGTHNIRHR